jgi:hypothetical protein
MYGIVLAFFHLPESRIVGVMRHDEGIVTIVGWVCVLPVELAAASEILASTTLGFRKVGQCGS